VRLLEVQGRGIFIVPLIRITEKLEKGFNKIKNDFVRQLKAALATSYNLGRAGLPRLLPKLQGDKIVL